MAISKCPLCGSPCILKIVATEDENWCKVDVCQMCQTMYPRGRTEVVIAAKGRMAAKARRKPGKARPVKKARAGKAKGR